MEDSEICWTKHFEKRLVERFGIRLNNELRESIEDQIKNKKPFTILDRRYSGKELDGTVYQVKVEDEKIMVLTTILACGTILFVTALRKSWVLKGDRGDGNYHYITNGTKPKKNKKVRIRKNQRAARLQYKQKKERMLLKCDNESCLI